MAARCRLAPQGPFYYSPRAWPSLNRKANYASLREAGFSREFARRHDKASPAEIRELIHEVRAFSEGFAQKQSQVRAAVRGRPEAIRALE